MSDLTRIEKRKLERELNMGSGYILNFSNRTFAEFMSDSAGIEIYDDKYSKFGDSKANRMRAFWDIESNYTVAKVLDDLLKDWDEYADYPYTHPEEDYFKILQRLKISAPVPDLESIKPNSQEKGFESLAKSVRESIEKNEPEIGLDRLHTFLVKYFRNLCSIHGVTSNKETPLHSLVGGYIKSIHNKGFIESEITERILKSTISIMEAFSKVRNNHSFAHDNKILNYNESLLIFSHVTSSVRFIDALENKNQESDVNKDMDNIPF